MTRSIQGFMTQDIDGHTYEFEQWGAEDGLAGLVDLSTIVGEPFVALFAGARDDGLDAEMAPGKLDALVKIIAQQLSHNRDKVLAMVHKLVTQGVQCDGKPVTKFNVHYRGRYAHMFKVCRAALEAQYGDFLSGLGVPPLPPLVDVTHRKAAPTHSHANPTTAPSGGA